MDTNNASFYAFIRLSEKERRNVLKQRGVLLDTDVNNNITVNLYSLDGFYVEETFTGSAKDEAELLPFKRGYKVESYSDNTPAKTPARRTGRNLLLLA